MINATEMPAPKITSIRYSRTPYRRKPQIGDRRTTKAHGLQVRVVETTKEGHWIRCGRSYSWTWRTPAQLRGTRWETYLTPEERAA